jgi:hypothetical protein
MQGVTVVSAGYAMQNMHSVGAELADDSPTSVSGGSVAARDLIQYGTCEI